MQCKMICASHCGASKRGLKLATRLQSLHWELAAELRIGFARCKCLKLNGQVLATLGATGIDHSSATTGLHANEKTVRACAANLGGLVSAFHFENPKGLNEDQPLLSGPVTRSTPGSGVRGTKDYRKFSQHRQYFALHAASVAADPTGVFHGVDKILINYNLRQHNCKLSTEVGTNNDRRAARQ